MTSIAIYLEGGGNGAAGKAALRQGFDAFLKPLKDAGETRGFRWKLVACGSRIQACNSFFQAHQSGDHSHVFLLVDSEEPVTLGPVAHLVKRDGQSQLSGIAEKFVHLMVQTMETWIVADAEALKAYYGQGFAANQLPQADNLETVAKTWIASALDSATRKTGKGSYHKIGHAKDLLGKISRQTVEKRCPSSRRFFSEIAIAIG